MQSPTPLDRDGFIDLSRRFHVEALRGGMNRLLLRAIPTKERPSRVEIFFQYVQHMDVVVRDVTREKTETAKYSDLLHRFSECRVFRLESGGEAVGHIVAAACVFGEDSEPSGAESMFPMMG